MRHMLMGTSATNQIKLGAFKTRGVKVLSVDDNPSNLIVTESLLSKYDIDVVSALGGREALVKAASDDFDIIFLDYRMSDRDGIETTKEIRDMGGKYTTVPIIAISGQDEAETQMFLDAGMNGFLSKPIIIAELHKLLLKFLPKEKVIL